MGTFRTSLGDEYHLERRLPRLAWRPRYRGLDAEHWDFPSFDADEFGVLAVIGAFLFVLFVVIVVVPILLFAAEVALVVAVVLPLGVLALAVGIVRHTVVLRRSAGGEVLAQRTARGPIASVRAARALRDTAEAGAYRVLTRSGEPAPPPAPGLGG